VQVALIVEVNPGGELFSGFFQAGELLQPQQFFFQGSHKPFGLGISFGVIEAGKDLLNVQGGGHPQERPGAGLTAVVGHQFQLLPPPPVGKLLITSLLSKRLATLGCGSARTTATPPPCC